MLYLRILVVAAIGLAYGAAVIYGVERASIIQFQQQEQIGVSR